MRTTHPIPHSFHPHHPDRAADKEPGGKKGGRGKHRAAAKSGEEDEDDDEYDPTRSPGQLAECLGAAAGSSAVLVRQHQRVARMTTTTQMEWTAVEAAVEAALQGQGARSISTRPSATLSWHKPALIGHTHLPGASPPCAGVRGENEEPNAYSSDSGSDDDSVVVVEPEPKPRQGRAAAAAGGSGGPAAGAPPQPLAAAASDFVGRLSIAQLQAMQKLSQVLHSGGRLQPAQVESLTSQLTPEQLRQMLDVAARLKKQPAQPSVLLQQAAPPAVQQAQQQQAQQRQLTPLELQQQQHQQEQQQAAQQRAEQAQPFQALVQQLYAQREAALAQHAAQQQSQRAQQWLEQQLAREAAEAKQQQQQKKG